VKTQTWASCLTLAILACTGRTRREFDSVAAIDTVADTMTTPAMRMALSRDYSAAEAALRAAEDSVDAALGPELTVQLMPLRTSFETYRTEQCERLKAAFKEGTFGPVAQLECLIHLTDSRREFIEQHYDFVAKLGGRPMSSSRAPRARRP